VVALRSAAPTPLRIEGARAVSSWHRVKPAVESCLAALAALLLAPLLLAIVVAVRVDSAGPAFFVQTRVGKDGRLFRIYKFRSMVTRSVVVQPGLDEHGNVLFKDPTDARVSRVGRWLRSTSLDELPQLINVAQGVMSLVGPRPFLPDETVLMDGSALERLAVRPGITGLWQVTGRGDLGWAESVALDSFYVRHCSPALDLRILAGTPRAVLSRRGAY
jgi:lipopolysaccharide/colanic/teichoic acid biosynthesis glycosyltransferase